MKKQPQNKVMAEASKKPNGTYVHMGSRVGRTRPTGMGWATYESMDTSGYSKGKKNFTVKYQGKDTGTINRKDVPAKIEEFKKGATADWSRTKWKSNK